MYDEFILDVVYSISYSIEEYEEFFNNQKIGGIKNGFNKNNE